VNSGGSVGIKMADVSAGGVVPPAFFMGLTARSEKVSCSERVRGRLGGGGAS
jgi:hypothetical protein